MMADTDNGYLEIVLGPMFSGKSSHLEQLYTKYKMCNVPTLVINHTCDASRYVTEFDGNTLSEDAVMEKKELYMITHDQHKIPCKYVSSLFDIAADDIEKHSVVLINEGQFFSELAEFVKELLEKKKTVVVCGLDGDYKRNRFGQILDLIPLCDKVTKLTSVCGICKQTGSPAIFTLRIDSKTRDQVLVGGAESYKPVCRACYVKETC